MKIPHDWIVPDWPAPTRVRSLITTRHGGASVGSYSSFNLGWHCGDDQTTVRANRALLRSFLPQEPKWLHQVHGTQVVHADTTTTVPHGDASVARRPGTVCAVMIADCLPVLLCDDDASVVGVAHAGWRGLSAGVIENTITAMNVASRRLMAYLGPAIGRNAFEVGAEVREAFMAHDSAAADAFRPAAQKWMADLFALARQRLLRSGVERIFGGGLCTYSDAERFYSYRREGTTGRMAALIWIDGEGPGIEGSGIGGEGEG